MDPLYIRLMDRLYLAGIWLAGTAIFFMSLIIPWGVFSRYVLGTGSQWPEPIAILLMMVFTFIGGAESFLQESDTLSLLSGDTLVGSFFNVLSGERLPSGDGRGSFAVHYGSGSPFASNQIVFSDFVLIPEPASVSALLSAGVLLLVWKRRRRLGAAVSSPG